MQLNDYQREAVKTKQPTADLLYLAIKTGIEANEMAQPVVKHHYHDAKLDLDALVDELGDILWYLANLAEAAGVGLNDVAQRNIDKLRKRHGESYNGDHYREPAHVSGSESWGEDEHD